MKRLLGKLEVWLDLDETRIPSSMSRTGEKTWDLVMRPGFDQTVMLDTKTRAGFQTVMAHEMGHFITQLTHDPTADARNWQFYELPDGSRTPMPLSVLANERLAWQLARIIYPALVPAIERHAIDSYERGAEKQREMILRNFVTYPVTPDQMESLAHYASLHPDHVHTDSIPDVDIADVLQDDAISHWEDDGGLVNFVMPIPPTPPPHGFTTPVDIAFYEAHKNDPRYFDQPSKWARYHHLITYLRHHPIAHVVVGVCLIVCAIYIGDKSFGIGVLVSQFVEVARDVTFDRMFD